MTPSLPTAQVALALGAGAPLMSREAFSAATGIPLGVLTAQIDRGYWPVVTIGKRSLVNVEAIRREALRASEHFTFRS